MIIVHVQLSVYREFFVLALAEKIIFETIESKTCHCKVQNEN